MNKIILYTTHCPKCIVLQKKLDEKNILYEICDDTEIMLQKNFMSSPMLEIDNNILDFGQAVKYINELE